MAAPDSLKIGDTVTHPEWPPGETRVVQSFSFFNRVGFHAIGKRQRIIPDRGVRIVYLDRDIEDDNAWMEEGLIKHGD